MESVANVYHGKKEECKLKLELYALRLFNLLKLSKFFNDAIGMIKVKPLTDGSLLII